MGRRFLPLTLAALCAAALVPRAASAVAPRTKGPWLHRVTPTRAEVRLEVDPPAAVTLELTTGGAPARVVESAEARRLHTLVLDGLEPSTRYTYVVRAPGAVKHGKLTTAPPDDSAARFRFLVYGDNRSDDAAHAAIVRAMVPVASDFLVHTGDFVEDGSSLPQWQTFFDVEAPLVRERCLFSCIGNHELVGGGAANYVRYFGEPRPGAERGAPLPEHLNGTFRWGNARFFLLNGMVPYRTGIDRTWLERALADADAEAGLVWRVAVVHHGPWSSGPHGENRHLHEAGVPALLRAHGVDLILAGHDHIYERGAADGLAYVVTGGGGAPTYRVKTKHPHVRRVESVRHFVEASVTPAAIHIAAIRPDGSTIERCALRKAAGWDCDAPSSGEGEGAAAATDASRETASSPPSRCACRAAGAPGRGAPYVLVTVAALSISLSRRRRARRR